MFESYHPQPLPPLDSHLDVTQNHYWTYHNLDALLQCKKPLTASQDEDLFIAVHQICELAFHQMIIDMERLLAALAIALQNTADPVIGNTDETNYFFQRVLRLYEVALTTMPILGTMRAFAEFRSSIGPTSGFQSAQFRQLELMSGVRKYWDGGTNDAEGKPHIAETEFNRRYGAAIERWLERYENHSLRYYYDLLCDRVEGNTPSERVTVLLQHPQAGSVLKAMRAYDASQTQFHRSHLGLAIQQLKRVGVDVGTGGTSFKTYLAKYEKELTPLFPGLSSK
jgi:tryptophan 2,3-dioxygenase